LNFFITGAHGFLGSHLRVRLTALGHEASFPTNRDWLVDPLQLTSQLTAADAIMHIAGVNRGSDSEVYDGNVQCAKALGDAVRFLDRPTTIVFANSIQSGSDTSYGSGKAQAAEILSSAADATGSRFVDVLLPNLFGEGGRPRYNSVVATFSHQLANGEAPIVMDDRTLTLLHAQDAAEILIGAATASPTSATIRPEGTAAKVSQLLEVINDFAATYRTGRIPALPDKFHLDLFNTYRSYLFPTAYPFFPKKHTDSRGDFCELVQSELGTAQTSFSTTQPEISRGNHYHLAKVERFLVLRGNAVIKLRHILSSQVFEFPVNGNVPAAVDMPTFYAHSITNTGNSELLTAFWTNDLFDPAHPDTYPVEVAPTGSTVTVIDRPR
jgi:UDP-2-acetamido-2,6-beta-L-arabino-hexul-4-ose reductase